VTAPTGQGAACPLAAPVTLVILAKAPQPGLVKTRLCPPCTPWQAAALAAAALQDTMAAVCATPAARRVLVLEGSPGPWVAPGMEVLGQRGEALDERLAAAFEDVGGPALLVGMDTPQVTPALLGLAASRLGDGSADAVLGPACDGGWWAIGLRRPQAAAFAGVPMSTATTGAAQRARLAQLGLRTAPLPTLCDVDDIATAHTVAALAPGTMFADCLNRLFPPAAHPFPVPSPRRCRPSGDAVGTAAARLAPR